jgi:hypothetical protein
MSSFTRKTVALVAPVVLLAGFSVLGAQSASANSAVHKFKQSGNDPAYQVGDGKAIETKAKVSISCNSITGIYNVSVKNLSVVGQDGTAFTQDAGKFVLTFGTFAGTAQVSLMQNPKTELFDAIAAGVFSDPATWCKTGTPGTPNVAIAAFDSGDSALGFIAGGEFS